MPLRCLCYRPEMAVAIDGKAMHWIFDYLLWDTSGAVRKGFWGGLWATRKLLVAVAGSALLTWWERIEHHPPDLALLALIHFVFVLAAISLVVHVGRWFSRGDKRSSSGS